MTTEYIVIKIGGVASKQLTPEILAKLSEWQQAGQKIVIVHGGGFAINQLMEENHIPIHKVNGLRVTGKSDMALIKEALVDIVGKNLAGQLTTAGLPAYQLVDELPDLVHADFLDQETYGFVGEVKNITNQTLVTLLSQGKLPLIPSLGYMIGIETTGNLGELVQSARDKGLIVLAAGTNVIRLLPPITLSDAEIEKGVALLSEIFD